MPGICEGKISNSIVQLPCFCFFPFKIFLFGRLDNFKLLFFRQFSKDSGKYIEEKKLRVVLISPPSSPVLLPVNGDMKHDPSNEINVQKDRLPSGVENIPPPRKVSSSPSSFPFQTSISLFLSICFDMKIQYLFFVDIYCRLAVVVYYAWQC